MNLTDYSKVMNDCVSRFVQSTIAEDLLRNELMKDMLFYGYEPPTRKQRIKYWWEDKKQRCKDIWTIISGGDIHNNCGY